MPEQEPKSILAQTMDRVKLEWIAEYRSQIRKRIDGLSTRKAMCDFDEGYNSALDDCLNILED